MAVRFPSARRSQKPTGAPVKPDRTVLPSRRRSWLRRALLVLAFAGVAVAAIIWACGPWPLATLRISKHPIYRLAISPDGTLLATAGFDTVTLWNTVAAKRVAEWPIPSPTEHLLFSPEGNVVVWDGYRDAWAAWDIASGQPTSGDPGDDWSIWVEDDRKQRRRSPDGTLAVRFNPTPIGEDRGKVFLIDTETNETVRVIEVEPPQVNDVAFSPRGTLLATASGMTDHPWPVSPAGKLQIWDPRTGEPLMSLDKHWGAVSAVGFLPDGRRLASASYDGTVKLWRIDPDALRR
jgi:WD40 repeat protein